MQTGTPSRTAYRVALRRAAHQLVDRPLVFPDPLALRILGYGGTTAVTDLRAPRRPHSVALRAYLVARSRFAEDVLQASVGAEEVHAKQYVLLGAGLDTFAYRNPYPGLRVFEVDHPDTQQWKLSLLRDAAIEIPAGMTHVPVDFQNQTLGPALVQAGLDPCLPTVFAWLGVTPYLSRESIAATLRHLSTCQPGSVLVLDYSLPRSALPHFEQLAFDSLAARVAAAGEPFQGVFLPEQIRDLLAECGWLVSEDLDRDAINARYFPDRSDDLRCLGHGGHLLKAVLQGSLEATP
ncbi:MAG: class I SAM-dependent methyltransferase [Janthinobacterium lividum]